MKAEDRNKAKAPAGKKEEKTVSPKKEEKPVTAKKEEETVTPSDNGVRSKLHFPELPTRQAIAFPLAVLFVALLIIGFTQVTTGSPLHLGIDFKGGTLITLNTDHSDQSLQSEFSSYPVSMVTDDASGTRSIEFTNMTADQENALAAYVNVHYPNSTISSIGSTFSSANQVQAVMAVIIAFIGMAITVFIIFRSPVPSAAVVMSAFSDIMFAMAMMDLFHVELTFGTLAALLMLVGYSVDTDILLTTKVLGERKYLEKKIATCRTTGLTMTGTAIVAFVVLFLVASFAWVVGLAAIPTLSNIALVMIFGLIADVINTWFFNAGLLKWYMESPAGRAKYG